MIELLNHVVNQPEVLAEIAPGYERVDLSRFFDHPRNMMCGDERGVLLFAYRGQDVYELHYCFTAQLRGRAALQAVRAALKTVFTRHNAVAICGATPRDNRAARMMNRALGARPIGVSVDIHGRTCINYVLERVRWAKSSAD